MANEEVLAYNDTLCINKRALRRDLNKSLRTALLDTDREFA
jgi:hypothetical protein